MLQKKPRPQLSIPNTPPCSPVLAHSDQSVEQNPMARYPFTLTTKCGDSWWPLIKNAIKTYLVTACPRIKQTTLLVRSSASWDACLRDCCSNRSRHCTGKRVSCDSGSYHLRIGHCKRGGGDCDCFDGSGIRGDSRSGKVCFGGG